MYRQYKPPKGNFVNFASLLPWWAYLLLAFISWIILHLIAGIQIEIKPGVEGLFNFAGKQIWITLAMFGRIVLPALFVFAAIKSVAQEIQSPLIAAAVLFLIAAILLCFLVTNRKVEKEWAEEELYGMDWEPFTFDIWKSGMDIDEIIILCMKNDIPLVRKSGLNFYKEFRKKTILPFKEEETLYSYQTNLMGEKARVSLFLTEKEKKLMKLSIVWEKGQTLFDPVKNIILDKKPIAKKIKRKTAVTTTIYKINKGMTIDYEITVGRRLKVTYNDLYLIQSDKTYKREQEEKRRRDAYNKDSGKFTDNRADSGQGIKDMYKWKDEKGKWHYSNVTGQ